MEVRCRKCGTVFEASLEEKEELCPICRRFSGGGEATAPKTPEEEEFEAGTNSCALHPGNSATEVCSRCGNFMCSLCVIRVGRTKVCAPCFNMLYSNDKAFVKLASFGERFGALCLDLLMLFFIWITVVVVLSLLIFTNRSERGGELYVLLMFLIVFGLWSFYMVGMWAFGGTSLGKKAFGIKIVGPDRKTPSLMRSLARFAMFWVSLTAFCIGFLWAAWEKKNRTWHDLVAGTEVIKVRRRTG